MSGRSKSFKTQGIILKRQDLGEADRLLTIFTNGRGKMKALAKGVRKPTNKSAGHVELYTLVDFVISHGRTFNIVTQAELIEPFLPLQDDLQRIGYASLFAELIDRFTVNDLEMDEAFTLLLRGLSWICEEDVDLRLAARYYELQLLEIMGYAPSLFNCAIGGEALRPIDQFFSIIEDGVVCPEHAEGYVNMIDLPLPIFKILRHMHRSNWDTIKVLNIPLLHHQKLQRVMHSSLIFLLEKRLQSVDFLRRIAHERDE